MHSWVSKVFPRWAALESPGSWWGTQILCISLFHCFSFFFETGPRCVAQASLELRIFPGAGIEASRLNPTLLNNSISFLELGKCWHRVCMNGGKSLGRWQSRFLSRQPPLAMTSADVGWPSHWQKVLWLHTNVFFVIQEDKTYISQRKELQANSRRLWARGRVTSNLRFVAARSPGLVFWLLWIPLNRSIISTRDGDNTASWGGGEARSWQGVDECGVTRLPSGQKCSAV